MNKTVTKENSKMNYYYKKESEKFLFYQIPKILFYDEKYKKLSIEAICLYSLMKDRMKLSRKNEWVDFGKEVYIYFTINEIKEFLRCGTNKAINVLGELDTKKGVGLIDKVKQGQGRPDRIYVKECICDNAQEIEKFDEDEERLEEEVSIEVIEAYESEHIKKNDQSFKIENANRDEKCLKDSIECVDRDIDKTVCSIELERNNEKFSNEKSCDLINKIQDFSKKESSNTNINNTNINNTNQPINPTKSLNRSERTEKMTQLDEIDVIDDNSVSKCNGEELIEHYERIIKKNIEYDILCQSYDKDDVDEIIDNMIEILCMKQKYIHVAQSEVYTELAKNRVMKIDMFKIKYILDCLEKNNNKIRNIKNYLRTAIYNASSTINNYYKNAVNYGMDSYVENMGYSS